MYNEIDQRRLFFDAKENKFKGTLDVESETKKADKNECKIFVLVIEER